MTKKRYKNGCEDKNENKRKNSAGGKRKLSSLASQWQTKHIWNGMKCFHNTYECSLWWRCCFHLYVLIWRKGFMGAFLSVLLGESVRICTTKWDLRIQVCIYVRSSKIYILWKIEKNVYQNGSYMNHSKFMVSDHLLGTYTYACIYLFFPIAPYKEYEFMVHAYGWYKWIKYFVWYTKMGAYLCTHLI